LAGAAALAGWPARTTDMALEQLVEASLLQGIGVAYRIPDLIRIFARELVLKQESATHRQVALRRLHQFELAQGQQAVRAKAGARAS
jgi:hypothetical protein